MIKNIKSHGIGLFLAAIMLTFIITASYSQNDGKVVNRTLCPRYSIINDEIAFKIDSIYTSMDSIWPICLQGYMYYDLDEGEVYNDNKLYYYFEAAKQFYLCEPLTEAVVTDKNGLPFLIIENAEIQSGCFMYEGDSVWVEYEDCPIEEDGGSVIAWHEFSFTLPNDVDSVWLSKRMHRVYSYKK